MSTYHCYGEEEIASVKELIRKMEILDEECGKLSSDNETLKARIQQEVIDAKQRILDSVNDYESDLTENAESSYHKLTEEVLKIENDLTNSMKKLKETNDKAQKALEIYDKEIGNVRP